MKPISSLTPDIDVNALMRGLVHELRNPLSAILTATSLLEPNTGLDEESEMLLDVVKKESRRMNRILIEFSSFVKPPMPQIEQFDLAALVREVAYDLQKDEIVQGRISIVDELPPSHWVEGDSIQTAQVLRHVITNAAEAMPQSGTLKISVCEENGSSDVCIEDSGSGLDESALEKAFQPFFSTKPAATGLGLSISRGLLRSFGGELTIENRGSAGDTSQNPPAGARARIHLSAARVSTAATEIDSD